MGSERGIDRHDLPPDDGRLRPRAEGTGQVEEFDLDSEDDAILDRIWDRIGAEEAAKKAAAASARAAKKRQARADAKKSGGA